MIPEFNNYKTYILRVWRMVHDDQASLVASLEECDGEDRNPPRRRAFPDLRALYEFLASESEFIPPTQTPDKIPDE